jgi:hypothetical protein
MAKRRESPNWETLDRLLKLAVRLLSFYELIRRVL